MEVLSFPNPHPIINITGGLTLFVKTGSLGGVWLSERPGTLKRIQYAPTSYYNGRPTQYYHHFYDNSLLLDALDEVSGQIRTYVLAKFHEKHPNDEGYPVWQELFRYKDGVVVPTSGTFKWKKFQHPTKPGECNEDYQI